MALSPKLELGLRSHVLFFVDIWLTLTSGLAAGYIKLSAKKAFHSRF